MWAEIELSQAHGYLNAGWPLVGSQVTRNHRIILPDLLWGPSAMTMPDSKRRPIRDAHDQRHVVLDHHDRRIKFGLIRRISGPNASVSRCATPPVGSSSSSTCASTASRLPSSTIRRVPVDRLPMA